MKKKQSETVNDFLLLMGIKFVHTLQGNKKDLKNFSSWLITYSSPKSSLS